VITLLADVNIRGHVARLISRMQGETWREFWDYLDVRCLTFNEVGLGAADTDAIIWYKCQELQMYLLTSNRNDDGPDSLQSVIRLANNSRSLPVFTVGDADSILSSTVYADRVIDRLIRYLLDRDNILGTGRLYLP
jgi:hypothetical protein